MSIQTIFLVLLGAAVFVIGTTNIRTYLRMQKGSGILSGKVLSSNLVEKRDKEERLIQHYCELTVQYMEGGKTLCEKVSSTMGYERGEEIRLIRSGSKLVPFTGKQMTLGTALAITLAGMGLAVFPIVYLRNGERDASVILVLLLILGGVVTLSSFLKDRKKDLSETEGEIVDVLYYRTGDNKKLSKPVESYYPLIRCSIRGREKVFLSAYNSSTKGTYKAGAKVKLFYDEKQEIIVEKKASPVLAVAAVLFWLAALVGIISILGG